MNKSKKFYKKRALEKKERARWQKYHKKRENVTISFLCEELGSVRKLEKNFPEIDSVINSLNIIIEWLVCKYQHPLKGGYEKCWIIQRCINENEDQYENWHEYSEPMTLLDAYHALDECAKKWPEYIFREECIKPLPINKN